MLPKLVCKIQLNALTIRQADSLRAKRVEVKQLKSLCKMLKRTKLSESPEVNRCPRFEDLLQEALNKCDLYNIPIGMSHKLIHKLRKHPIQKATLAEKLRAVKIVRNRVLFQLVDYDFKSPCRNFSEIKWSHLKDELQEAWEKILWSRRVCLPIKLGKISYFYYFSVFYMSSYYF
jgi:hypothetical protein